MKKVVTAVVLVLALILCLCGCVTECTEHKDENHDGKCDVCGAEMEVRHIDQNRDGKCDICGADMEKECTEHKDENQDGKCDVCGADVPLPDVYSVEITNEGDISVYETKTVAITTTYSPAKAEVAYTSSDEEIATVSSEGVVTGVKAGTATIRAAVKADVYDEIDVTVKGTVINTSVNTQNFDWTNLYRDDAVIKSGEEFGNAFNSFAVFNGTASKYYVATATVKVTDPSGTDTWSRVGISHYNAEADSYYGLQLSPGPSFNQRKTVTMVITDNNVQWGAVTDRSQVWNQHNLAAINFDSLKLTSVRNGSEYYAYINDQLYYYENTMSGFDDADTVPVLNAGSCRAEFSAMSVSYGRDSVAAYLNDADCSQFYGSFADTIIGTDGSIKFTGAADSTCNLNPKDHGAKSIGSAAVLPADIQGIIEFDLTIDAFGSRDAMPALAVTLNRYDSDPLEARSLVIGQYKAGWTGWKTNGDLNAGIGSGGVEYSKGGTAARLEEGKTYRVTFTRLMTANGQDTKLTVKDSDGNVLLEHTHGWQDGYSGRVVVSFLSRDLDCTITNITFCTEHADENHDGKCDKCGTEMLVNHVDQNHDGKCDVCEADVVVNHTDGNHDGKCDVCEADMTVNHIDENNDGKCDVCGADMETECTEHKDENQDGKCDICGEDVPLPEVYSVEITNEGDISMYETKTVALTVSLSPANAQVTYTSSDTEIAVVSDNGVVTGLKAGTVTIRASVKEDVYDEITVVVNGVVINTAINNAHFDWTNLYRDDAVIKSGEEFGNAFNSYAAFNGTASKYYVATAVVKVTDPATVDDWSRVGISHYNAEADSYYGLQLSPGPSFNQRKTVTMVITDNVVQWGAVTDRSQVWNQHNLAAINFDSVKLTAVRNGSEYYAYINDQLYYYENTMSGFDDADTVPVLNAGSCRAEFSAMSVSYGRDSVTAFLGTADSSIFYGSFADTVIGADGSVKFTGAADSTCSLNAKDHGAKSIGAAAALAAGVEGTVSFDLTIDAFGSRDAMPALAVTINRYDGTFAEARSLVIGQYKAGWTGWNTNGDLNAGIGSGGVEYSKDGTAARLEEGQTYRVTFTRLMTANGQDTKLTVKDSEGNVLLEHTHEWQDGYSGRVVVSFLSRDLDCTISNISINSAAA